MPQDKKTKKPANKGQERVANYRARAERQGFQRVETTVLEKDARLVKDIARVLREDNEQASELRYVVRSLLPQATAQTGEELLEFFRHSPLAEGDAIEFERDQSMGHTTSFDV